MHDVSKMPGLIRNVSLLGHLHSGKSSLMDLFVRQTHHFPPNHEFEKKWRLCREVRYTDYRVDEQQKGLSIKAVPMSFLLQSSSSKSYLFNIMDVPGHVNFNDEAIAALRISDGAIIVIDAVEGVMMNTERLIRYCVLEHIPIVRATLARLIL
jgi:116 kDa U5 small nuclear ribonucleoprotein component